jgi:hypothetical protein
MSRLILFIYLYDDENNPVEELMKHIDKQETKTRTFLFICSMPSADRGCVTATFVQSATKLSTVPTWYAAMSLKKDNTFKSLTPSLTRLKPKRTATLS